MARDPESLGSSSKSLTTLFWNLGNWDRGKNWLMPSFIDPDKICYKENKPDVFPDHVPELQMLKNIMMVCEAGTLGPHREYVESHGWSLCFNDAKDLCCLARLGMDGKIVQITGPQEENKKTFGMVQTEKFHLQSLRSHGERQFSEALMQHPRQVILVGMWKQNLRTWKEPEYR